MAEWQPIETAPDSDGEILVFVPRWGCEVTERLRDGRWMVAGEGEIHDAPSHWMPLPPEPEATA